MTYTINAFVDNELGVTSNGVQKTLMTFTPNLNSSSHFDLVVTARKESSGAVKMWKFRGYMKRGNGDSEAEATLVQLLGTTGDLAELLLADVSLDINNALVRTRIIGIANTDLNWYGSMVGEIMFIDPV